MAQTTIYTDDIDGSAGAETLTFALKGKTYTIDLAPTNQLKLQDALKPFIAKATEIRSVSAAPSAPKASKGTTGASKVITDDTYARRWHKANNLPVGDRGRLKPEQLEAWRNAGSVKLDT